MVARENRGMAVRKSGSSKLKKVAAAVIIVIVIALVALFAFHGVGPSTAAPPGGTTTVGIRASGPPGTVPYLSMEASPSTYGQRDIINATPGQKRPNDTLKIVLITSKNVKLTEPNNFDAANLAAGVYTVYAYDIEANSSSSSQTLVINKAKLQLNLTAPLSFNFNQNGGKILFAVSSTNDQVNATLSVNNATINTGVQGTYTTSPNPNTYNIMLVAMPSANYTGANASASFSIKPNIVFNKSTTLTGDVNVAGNIIVEGGVTLTTDGYSLIAGGSITNFGTIRAGLDNGGSYSSSYGGSGGGGGGAYYDPFYPNVAGSPGGSTYGTPGGAGGINASASSNGANGGNGGTPDRPALSNAQIQSWYGNGIQNYFAGGGGGNTGTYGGGDGSYGIYLQGNKVDGGTVFANGANGGEETSGGGGGGGVLLIAYSGSGYTSGLYNITGGAGGSGFSLEGSTGGSGGNGGNGQVLIYNYTTPPIQVCSGVCIGPNKYP